MIVLEAAENRSTDKALTEFSLDNTDRKNYTVFKREALYTIIQMPFCINRAGTFTGEKEYTYYEKVNCTFADCMHGCFYCSMRIIIFQ